MNDRQREYFRAKLLAWKDEILRESRLTLQTLQEENVNHPDLADRASSETDRAIELRARDRQRKLISKIDAALQRIEDNDADFVTPLDMLAELRDDNKQLVANLRETHGLCDEQGDVATASMIEVWIDEAERRTWFLFEASRQEGSNRPCGKPQAAKQSGISAVAVACFACAGKDGSYEVPFHSRTSGPFSPITGSFSGNGTRGMLSSAFAWFSGVGRVICIFGPGG